MSKRGYMYNYKDIEKISGVKKKVTKQILKEKKMNNQKNFSENEVKIIINAVDRYELRITLIRMFLIIMTIIATKIIM